MTFLAEGHSSVRTRPDPQIVARGPVDQVVAAFLARSRVVGHLIGRKPGPFTEVLRQCVKVCAKVVRWKSSQLPTRMALPEDGSVLDGQLVE